MIFSEAPAGTDVVAVRMAAAASGAVSKIESMRAWTPTNSKASQKRLTSLPAITLLLGNDRCDAWRIEAPSIGLFPAAVAPLPVPVRELVVAAMPRDTRMRGPRQPPPRMGAIVPGVPAPDGGGTTDSDRPGTRVSPNAAIAAVKFHHGKIGACWSTALSVKTLSAKANRFIVSSLF